MATTTIRVPVNGNSREMAGWSYNVSAELAAGNDVKFVDDINGTTEVNVFRVNVATAGTLKHRAAGQADNQAQALYYTAGWNESAVGICKVFVADSTAGLNARVAIG